MTCYNTQSYHPHSVSVTMKQVRVETRVIPDVNTFTEGG